MSIFCRYDILHLTNRNPEPDPGPETTPLTDSGYTNLSDSGDLDDGVLTEEGSEAEVEDSDVESNHFGEEL